MLLYCSYRPNIYIYILFMIVTTFQQHIYQVELLYSFKVVQYCLSCQARMFFIEIVAKWLLLFVISNSEIINLLSFIYDLKYLSFLFMDKIQFKEAQMITNDKTNQIMKLYINLWPILQKCSNIAQGSYKTWKSGKSGKMGLFS